MSSSSSCFALLLLAAIAAAVDTDYTIILTPDELEEYQTTPLNAVLDGSVSFICNGTTLSLYNVNKEMYDNCTAINNNIRLGRCSEPDGSFLYRLFPASFMGIVQYRRGETFYFAAYTFDGSSPAPCMEGVKFAIHIINESTITTTVQMAPSTTMVPASSTVALEISTTAAAVPRSTTVQIPSFRTTTVTDLVPTTSTTQSPTRPPISTTGGVPSTNRLTTDETEQDAIIAASVGAVLGVLIIIAILGVIAFLLVLILQRHQQKRKQTIVVDPGSEKPKALENPLYMPALGNDDSPATPKTPKEIRFQNMYSNLDDFSAKKKRRQTWLF